MFPVSSCLFANRFNYHPLNICIGDWSPSATICWCYILFCRFFFFKQIFSYCFPLSSLNVSSCLSIWSQLRISGSSHAIWRILFLFPQFPVFLETSILWHLKPNNRMFLHEFSYLTLQCFCMSHENRNLSQNDSFISRV